MWKRKSHVGTATHAGLHLPFRVDFGGWDPVDCLIEESAFCAWGGAELSGEVASQLVRSRAGRGSADPVLVQRRHNVGAVLVLYTAQDRQAELYTNNANIINRNKDNDSDIDDDGNDDDHCNDDGCDNDDDDGGGGGDGDDLRTLGIGNLAVRKIIEVMRTAYANNGTRAHPLRLMMMMTRDRSNVEKLKCGIHRYNLWVFLRRFPSCKYRNTLTFVSWVFRFSEKLLQRVNSLLADAVVHQVSVHQAEHTALLVPQRPPP